MTIRAASLFFIASVTSFGACASPRSSGEPSAIIGGTSDTGDPSVVALYAQTSSSGALCTASVIAPTVLLTAAHCVLPSEVGEGATFTALPSDNVNTDTSEQWAVKETHYDTAFDINELENGHDIAIAILEEAVTQTPLVVNTSDPSSLQGSDVKLVGYGLSNGSAQTGAGVKRSVNAPVDSVQDKLLEIGGDGKDTCNGDSGGPAIATLDGKSVIVGITSFGESGCGDGGYDTRVDLYSSFLAKYLGGSGSAPSTKEASEKEPNDSSSEANAFSGTIDGALSPTGDVDWFEFKLSKAAEYTLTLSTTRTSSTFRVYKLAPSGSLSEEGEAVKGTLSKSSTSGGTYYVKVYDDGKAHTDDGDYTLTLH